MPEAPAVPEGTEALFAPGAPEQETPDAGRRREHVDVVVVGGGQAGLSASWYLQERGIDHVVLERATAAHEWQDSRWGRTSATPRVTPSPPSTPR